jgi:crotonobetainyl-CoA:carnitine CoA-transferase CaiB-like acyl-CoA transferase
MESRTPVAAQALADLRVIEFTAGMAGPWIGRFMAHCGADVIKVESKKRPDVTRQYVPPWAPERGIEPQLSPWLTDWNAGKRCVALDLTNPDAVALAHRLVATADVVVENFTPGVLAKLGLGWDSLVRVKPDLVVLSTSGFGDSGPRRSYVSWGPNIEAAAGLTKLSGFPERECTMTHYAYPDSLSGLHGLFAVMCALDHRRRTGEGQYVNLSQLEATIAVIGEVMMEGIASGGDPPRPGNRSAAAAPHGCYRCRGDDRWCAVAAFDESEWQALCRAAGRPEWAADPRFATLADRRANEDALDRCIESWTIARDAYDVMATLQAAGVAAGVVQTTEDRFRRDPQLAARGFFERIAHHAKGEVVADGIPLGLTGTPGRTTAAGAAVGHDNEAVFGGLLGLAREEIDRLIAVGAIEAAG